MKLREVGTLIFIGIIVVSAGYAIFKRVKPNVFRDDNFVEEIIESQLEKQLGLEEGTIDLTPFSDEE